MTVLPVLLKGDELFEKEQSNDPYGASRDLSKYLLMHYGELDDVFQHPQHPLAIAHGYPQRLSTMLEDCARRTGTRVTRALDVGCSVGGISTALSAWVEDLVVGLDSSQRSVEIAQSLVRHGGGVFSVIEQGPFVREIQFQLPEPARRGRLEFEVGDGCAVRPPDVAYDAALLSNVLDRVDDPLACLAQFSDTDRILRAGGLLMISCPWSWYAEFSHPRTWFGSADGSVTSDEALKEILRADFDLVMESDEAGVLRQNPREYDYFESHVTIWQKR